NGPRKLAVPGRPETGGGGSSHGHHVANQSDAYLHYLKGRFFWNKRSEQGFELAIREFQSAIDKVPAYAQAYAGLADSYNLSSSYELVPAKTYMPRARAAALRALELDESLADAHTSLA